MKNGGGAAESPLSMGPERPRYATAYICKSRGIIQFHFTEIVTLVCKILCTARQEMWTQFVCHTYNKDVEILFSSLAEM